MNKTPKLDDVNSPPKRKTDTDEQNELDAILWFEGLHCISVSVGAKWRHIM